MRSGHRPAETSVRLRRVPGPWRRAQHCIIPAEAFWEPDWRSGKNVWTRISRADGKPMGIAGLWSWWRPPGGSDDVHSFTMLTINVDTHPVMCNYHRPDDEKQMVVILREEDFDAWLDAPADRSIEFMRQCPPSDLLALGIYRHLPKNTARLFCVRYVQQAVQARLSYA
jgi:putative SOS response-associated peptidase YedK